MVHLSPPNTGSLREGHRGLLVTFREFARDLDRALDQPSDPAHLRGMLAFLRQSLLPFARREEAVLDGCPELTEDTAFEHAFLHAEIDALAAATAELEHSSIDRRSGLARPVVRHVHRFEALLELHVQKAEDRERRAA